MRTLHPASGGGGAGGGAVGDAGGGGGSAASLTAGVSRAQRPAATWSPRKGGTLGRVRALAVTLLALAALAAAGCGSSDDGGGDATQAWADGLCSSLQEWTESVQSAGATLQDTSSLSPEALGGALESVIGATSTLADDVQSLGRPEVDSAEQAQETVTTLADTLQDDAATLQRALDEADDAGLTGLLEQLSTITATLGSMASAVGQAFSDLQELDVQGELESAFTDSESCSEFVS
jgi:hypothetical protein